VHNFRHHRGVWRHGFDVSRRYGGRPPAGDCIEFHAGGLGEFLCLESRVFRLSCATTAEFLESDFKSSSEPGT
jgi:hypothetical protein